jgi:tetratricopeptide (TPR) repeat protein
MARLYEWTNEGATAALALFHEAVAHDPAYAAAYGMAAWCYVQRKGNGWLTDPVREKAEAARLAWRAVELGPNDAIALLGGGYALVFVAHDLDDGAAYLERSLTLNPNLSWGLTSSGWTKAFKGEPDAAIEELLHAIRLSPLDPLSFRAFGGIAFAHLLAGRYDDAVSWAEKALRERHHYLPAVRELAAAHALAGRPREAQKAMALLREIDPAVRVRHVKDWVPLRRAGDLATLEEGLRKAGLPE